MEFEVLKRSHLKRNVIIGLFVATVITTLILNFTKASYRTTQSIPLVSGTINYNPFDIKVSTKLLVGEEEYIELDNIPTSNNISLMSSDCTNNVIINYNVSEQGYEVSNLTQRGTKCEMKYAMRSSIDTDYHAYQPDFDMNVEVDGQNVIVTVTPNSGNLFNISKYYYSINDEYIESNNNTYTFDNLEEGEYEVKVYVVDEKNLTSEVKNENVNIVKGMTVQEIIANTGLGSGTPNFANTSCLGGCDEATNGLYTAQDEDGTTYYFRGTVDNNWVKFAGFYWRIIRFNGDGSIRLIYSGSEASGPAATGDNTQIGNYSFNTDASDNAYVGYMYELGVLHGLKEDSNAKKVLDEWYVNNILNKGYSKYISEQAGFCGDRTTYSGSGIGTTSTTYNAYNRVNTNHNPTFLCSNNLDLYTTTESNKGNKALTYPIGLITADEIAYAGGVWDTINRDFYLYTDNMYWSITPHDYTEAYKANMFAIDSSGCLYYGFGVNDTHGVRPVINLKADMQINSGNGTASQPYIVN